MKSFALLGTVLSLASAVSYTAWLATSLSEASVLMFWGCALLVVARSVRVEHPVSKPQIIVARPNPDVRATGAIRLQPGV